MKNSFIYLITAILLAVTVFSSIGFARVNDTLTISGALKYELPREVIITSAEFSKATNSGTATIDYFTKTLLSSNITLGSSSNDTVHIKLTVKNNTKYSQTFDGIKFSDDCYSNNQISVTTDGITKGDVLQAGEQATFYAVFSYKTTAASNNKLNSLLNFSFVLSSEFVPDAAVGNAVERFEEILNNGIEYNELVNAMEDVVDSGRPNTQDGKTYIGNVIGSSGKDSQAIHNIFSKNENGVINDYLTLTVGDKTVDVTVIIKREDADNNPSTDDITLYLTPQTPNGNYYTKILGFYVDRQDRRNVLSPVYAVVFKYNNGIWEQITPLFAGSAGETVYGSPSGYNAKCDSFNTNTWKSTEKYWNINRGADIGELTKEAINRNYIPE